MPSFKIDIPGPPHQTRLVEATGLACVTPPAVYEKLHLKRAWLTPNKKKKVHLSRHQIEAALYAFQSHRQFFVGIREKCPLKIKKKNARGRYLNQGEDDVDQEDDDQDDDDQDDGNQDEEMRSNSSHSESEDDCNKLPVETDDEGDEEEPMQVDESDGDQINDDLMGSDEENGDEDEEAGEEDDKGDEEDQEGDEEDEEGDEEDEEGGAGEAMETDLRPNNALTENDDDSGDDSDYKDFDEDDGQYVSKSAGRLVDQLREDQEVFSALEPIQSNERIYRRAFFLGDGPGNKCTYH